MPLTEWLTRENYLSKAKLWSKRLVSSFGKITENNEKNNNKRMGMIYEPKKSKDRKDMHAIFVSTSHLKFKSEHSILKE